MISQLAINGAPPRTFIDRRNAGLALASAAKRLRLPASTIVLALPRGGVPVAFEVAKALRAPLDVLVVRKIGAQTVIASAPVASEDAATLIGAEADKTLFLETPAHLSSIGEWYDDFGEIEDDEVSALLERPTGERE